MENKLIVSDFDGVIGNSLKIALTITRKITALFDKKEEVITFQDYYRLLGKKSELEKVTEIESDILRELYRIMYRHHSNEIKPFKEILEIYSNLFQKPLIVSSSYADAIRLILKEHQNIFDAIYGYESGHKKDLLCQLQKEYQIIYLTDTFRDIMLCRNIGVPVIATCWGYDTIEKIRNENPDYLVRNATELKNLLTELNCLQVK